MNEDEKHLPAMAYTDLGSVVESLDGLDVDGLTRVVREESGAISRALHERKRLHVSALCSAIRAGEALNRIKVQTKHGEWEAWVAANWPHSPSLAKDYMRLARNANDNKAAQIDSAVDLEDATSIRGALKRIAAKPAIVDAEFAVSSHAPAPPTPPSSSGGPIAGSSPGGAGASSPPAPSPGPPVVVPSSGPAAPGEGAPPLGESAALAAVKATIASRGPGRGPLSARLAARREELRAEEAAQRAREQREPGADEGEEREPGDAEELLPDVFPPSGDPFGQPDKAAVARLRLSADQVVLCYVIAFRRRLVAWLESGRVSDYASQPLRDLAQAVEAGEVDLRLAAQAAGGVA